MVFSENQTDYYVLFITKRNKNILNKYGYYLFGCCLLHSQQVSKQNNDLLAKHLTAEYILLSYNEHFVGNLFLSVRAKIKH